MGEGAGSLTACHRLPPLQAEKTLSTFQEISKTLKWLFGQSIFIKIGQKEIHHLSKDELEPLAKEHDLHTWEIHQLLHILSLGLLRFSSFTGFIDLSAIRHHLPENFFHEKEHTQIETLYAAVCSREHYQEVSLTRFAFSNPYVICWVPESVAEAIEQHEEKEVAHA